MAGRFQGYEIRRFKSFRGREGLGFNADLWMGDGKVGEVDDAGNGGCMRFHFVSKDAEAAFRSAVASHRAAHPSRYSGFEDSDRFMALMVDEHETMRRWRRQAKDKTLIQVGAEINGETYRVLEVPFTPELKERLMRRFDGQPIRWINEEVARG